MSCCANSMLLPLSRLALITISIGILSFSGKAVSDEQRAGIAELMSLRGFGAKCDGVTDDGRIINRAIEALHFAGGGTLEVPPGVCRTSVTIILRNGVYLRGSQGVSTLKLKDFANVDLLSCYDDVQSIDCRRLFGSRNRGGWNNSGISGLLIDGNSSHNTSGSCFLWYGYNIRVQNVRFQNCADYGWKSEWYGVGFKGAQSGYFQDVTIDTSGNDGLNFSGPNDAIFSGLLVSNSSQKADKTYNNITFNSGSGHTQVSLCHVFRDNGGYFVKYGIEAKAPILFSNCQFEGSWVANLITQVPGVQVDSSSVFYYPFNGVNVILNFGTVLKGRFGPEPLARTKLPSWIAVVLGDGSGFSADNNIDITIAGDHSNGCVDFTNGRGNNFIRCTGQFGSSRPAYVGKPAKTDTAYIAIRGSSSSVLNLMQPQ